MSDILDKLICLQLNALWQPVGIRTPKQAIISLCSQSGGEHPCMAIDFETVKDDDGNDVLTYANPLTWEEWLLLPIRPQDLTIHSAHQEIRVPIVTVAVNFSKIPRRRARVSSRTIYERDGGIDQYTGKPVARHRATLDHIHPRSRGGRDSFENLVICDKDINMAKADRTPQEAGMKLIRQPKAPPDMPVIIRKDQARHDGWIPFLGI